MVGSNLAKERWEHLWPWRRQEGRRERRTSSWVIRSRKISTAHGGSEEQGKPRRWAIDTDGGEGSASRERRLWKVRVGARTMNDGPNTRRKTSGNVGERPEEEEGDCVFHMPIAWPAMH